METQFITCPMCGQRFDPDQHVSCNQCPLQRGCQLVCCPFCGYQTVDPSESKLAKVAARWLFGNSLEKNSTNPNEHRSKP